MSELWAGTGRCDITPAPGTPQGGWGAQTHQRGLGADMPFYATALVLSDGQEMTAIVDVDSIGFDDEWTGRIIQAIEDLSGIPRNRIRFSCTHTHSGPNTFRLATISEGLDMALGYLNALPQRIAASVWQAQKNLTRVRCAAGSGWCDINVNRRFRTPEGTVVVGRNWEGTVDRTVRVVRFDNLNEQPVATIVHYACHPTTMAWDNQLFTPDYPGAARKVVEDQVGGRCLFLQGATGNITPRRGFTGDTRVYRRLGAILGLEASRVALNLETLPRQERYLGVMQSGAAIALYEDEACEAEAPVLQVAERVVPMPVKSFPPVDVLEDEAEACRAELSRLRMEGTPEEVRAATARATQAGWRAGNARQYTGKTAIDWRVQCIRIGSIALLASQGEPFIEVAQQITAGSPFEHTLFSGYSNGAFGYIPTRRAFEEGGYETEATPFAPGAAEFLAAEGVRFLREMAGAESADSQ
jgi:hypothetical protein